MTGGTSGGRATAGTGTPESLPDHQSREGAAGGPASGAREGKGGFLASESGVAILEFLLVLPLFAMFMVLAVEGARYMTFRLSLERAAFVVSQALTRAPSGTIYTSAQANAIATMAGTALEHGKEDSIVVIATPMRLETPGSGTVLSGPVARKLWSYTHKAAFGSHSSSLTPHPGLKGYYLLDSSLTSNLTVGDELVAVEVYARFVPLFAADFSSNLLGYSGTTAYYRPRLSAPGYVP